MVNAIDGVLVQWGDRLFYPANRGKLSRTPALTGLALQHRAIEDDRGVVREGKEALHAIVDQWRFGGSRIPEVSERREAFNIMLSTPAGTNPRLIQQAAREFAKVELANHRYVMVLHNHQANSHVHISVRAEGRDGLPESISVFAMRAASRVRFARLPPPLTRLASPCGQ